MEIYHNLSINLSKSAAADLLYVGKGLPALLVREIFPYFSQMFISCLLQISFYVGKRYYVHFKLKFKSRQLQRHQKVSVCGKGLNWFKTKAELPENSWHYPKRGETIGGNFLCTSGNVWSNFFLIYGWKKSNHKTLIKKIYLKSR